MPLDVTTPPAQEDTPGPISAERQPPAAETGAMIVKDRHGGRLGRKGGRLDKAMKDARQLKVHLPHQQFEVDEGAVRRAMRSGRAEDRREATLDQVMKQRRKVDRLARSGQGELGIPIQPTEPPAEEQPVEAGAGRQLMGLAIVMALLILGLMVAVAVKLL